MTPKPRYVTKPGCACVCKDCGAALELACPNGHNPGQYVLGTEELQPLPHERRPPVAAPNGQARKIRVIPSPTGLCACGEVFTHEKKRGRRHTRCPKCRGAEA